jgi:hypothetical protein
MTRYVSKPTKRSMFSAAVFAQIATMVDQGLSATQIAVRIGCTIGTLRVKCSHYGLSLRRRAADEPKSLNIKLSHDVALQLNRQARKERVSGTKLAADLIEAIVRDQLYDAVIDRRPAPAALSSTSKG